VLPEQNGSILPPRFRPNGQSLLIVNKNQKTARVYRTEDAESSEFGKERMNLSGHEEGVTKAEWMRDGNRILTGSGAGRIRIWPVFDTPQALIDTARTQVTRPLTDAQREEFNLIQ
jgi:WD40 repeat protein